MNGWYRGGEVVENGRMLAGPGSWDGQETKAHHLVGPYSSPMLETRVAKYFQAVLLLFLSFL